MTTTSISRDRKHSAAGDCPADTALWEAFAEGTVSRDARIAGPLGRKLAFKARHRKPNRRRASIVTVLGVFALVAAIVGGISAAARTVQPAPFYGMTPGQAAQVAATLEAPAYQLTAYMPTPAQEAAACAAVYHYHHENATDYGGVHAAATERAWYHAWHLAGYADQLQGDSMRYNIRHYLATGRGWSLVNYDCRPDA